VTPRTPQLHKKVVTWISRRVGMYICLYSAELTAILRSQGSALSVQLLNLLLAASLPSGWLGVLSDRPGKL
jgi:hypothetical protein